MTDENAYIRELDQLIKRGIQLDRSVQELCRVVCQTLDNMKVDSDMVSDITKIRNKELIETMIKAIDEATNTIKETCETWKTR